MIEPTMKRAKGDGVEIQLAIWEGKGDPVLCIHGLTANCRSWDRIASPWRPITVSSPWTFEGEAFRTSRRRDTL